MNVAPGPNHGRHDHSLTKEMPRRRPAAALICHGGRLTYDHEIQSHDGRFMNSAAESESELVYGRLAAWLAVNALGDTGLDEAGKPRNNIGALPFPDLFAGYCTRVSQWICPLWR